MNHYSERRRCIKLFLVMFMPAFVVVVGSSILFYSWEERKNFQQLQRLEKQSIAMQVDAFKHEFQSIVSDLMVLSDHQALNLIINDSLEKDYSHLANEFSSFVRNKKMYDQLRLLDEKGMELLRVNYNQGKVSVAAAEQLQDKSQRYYFQQTRDLHKHEIFVSRLDLNIEGDALEYPLKPMVRFGMPLINNKGEKRGVIILNYFGNQVIKHLLNASYQLFVPKHSMLINAEGYFFKGMDSEDEWGFMLDERKSKTFAQLFAKQWQEIDQHESGQILDEMGLFTFHTVYPLAEALKVSSGQERGINIKTVGLDETQHHWKLVTFISDEALQGLTQKVRGALVLLNLLFVLFGGIGLWLFAGLTVKRQTLEASTTRLAYFDSLTGLPNRMLLEDRLNMSLARAQRDKQMLAVLFLDLDGFKDVNDQLGHKAGDAALKEIAQRIERCIRQTDTAARLGGDEFVLLLSAIIQIEDANRVAENVLAALEKPIMLKGGECTIGVSIGIATYPHGGLTYDDLLNHADTAMYKAKKDGKNNYHNFS